MVVENGGWPHRTFDALFIIPISKRLTLIIGHNQKRYVVSSEWQTFLDTPLFLPSHDRSHDEMSELAAEAFELSQTLRQQWLTADNAAKRRILEIVLLICSLAGVTLCPTIRKPFDVLAEGLVSKQSGGDRTPMELFLAGMRELNREIGRKIIVSRLDSERFQFRGNSIAAGRM